MTNKSNAEINDSLDGASLTGCYGRVYKSSATIKADFEKGLDFKFNKIVSRYDGKPCSIRDMEPGDTVKLRYGTGQFVMYTKGEISNGHHRLGVVGDD